VDEPLAILLLPCRLEDFELAAHARDLLEIPRAVAVEPRRGRRPRRVGDVAAVRQARRLRFPGAPRVIVLYHPAQYPLARALCGRHQGTELWYVRQAPGALEDDELRALDELASERAVQQLTATAGGDPRDQNQPLRRRLVELDVISSRPFVPGARVERR
jgi:hypothetical protein